MLIEPGSMMISWQSRHSMLKHAHVMIVPNLALIRTRSGKIHLEEAHQA